MLGTLVDQITYPETAANKSVSMEELTAILSKFQLGYLLDRPGVLEDEVNWEEELSLGEKQRWVAVSTVNCRALRTTATHSTGITPMKQRKWNRGNKPVLCFLCQAGDGTADVPKTKICHPGRVHLCGLDNDGEDAVRYGL